jgi:hypothetical protein
MALGGALVNRTRNRDLPRSVLEQASPRPKTRFRQMRIPLRRPVAGLLSSFVLACAAPDEGGVAVLSSPPEPGSTVTNREPAWTRGSRWTMGRTPMIEIGGRGRSGPNAVFKVVGVLRLDDGNVVVANGSSGELKYFDRTGAHMTTSGGAGWTPGTFRVLGWIQPLETGGIVAYDESKRSLSVFDETGTYQRTLMDGYDPRANGAFLTIAGVFDDESVLIHQSRLDEKPEGHQRSDEWFVRVPKFGVPAAVTGAFPGTEIIRRQFINARDFSRPPFGRAAHAAVAPSRFYVGDDDEYVISAFAPDGTLLHRVRLEGAERPVTPAVIDEYVKVRMVPHPQLDRKSQESGLRAMVTHKTLPAFSGLRSDPDGNLWVRDYEVGLPADHAERWNVFDANGRYLGALDMPKAFRLLTIGVDYLAGVARDRFGTEQVRIYELKKPRG